MIKKILLVVAVVLVSVIGYLAFKGSSMPDKMHIERSIVINAPTEIVFGQVNSLKNWEKWSPWFERDPNQKITYNNIPEGKGALYGWDGNKEVGKGTMAIEDSRQNQLVEIDLKFTEPFEANPDGGFDFSTVEGGATKIVWRYDENVSSLGTKMIYAAMGMNEKKMDEMLGADFEKGLAKLKSVAELEVPVTPQIPVLETPQSPPKK